MESAVPKYYYIKKDILSKINQEIFKVDDTIPSEQVLMNTYGVSRITVRKAIDELVSECHLYKVQGKGTYVKGNSRVTGLSAVMSCTEEIIQQGFTPSRKLILSTVEKSNKRTSRELGIEENSDILHIVRVYYADNDPVIYCENYIVLSYFLGIEDVDFETNSVYKIIEKKYNTEIVDSTRFIEAISAHEGIAELLNVEQGYPTLRFSGVTRGMIGNKVIPFELFDSSYKTGKIKFRIDQKPIK